MTKEEALAVALDWVYDATTREKDNDNDSEATQQAAGVGKENGEAGKVSFGRAGAGCQRAFLH